MFRRLFPQAFPVCSDRDLHFRKESLLLRYKPLKPHRYETHRHRRSDIGHRTRSRKTLYSGGLADRGRRPARGGARKAPHPSSGPDRDRIAGHHARRCARTSVTPDRQAGRNGHLPALFGHRETQHRAASRHRDRHPAHQRRRIRAHGDGGFRLFPRSRRRHLAVISSIAGTKGLGSAPPTRPPNACRTPTSTHWRSWRIWRS